MRTSMGMNLLDILASVDKVTFELACDLFGDNSIVIVSAYKDGRVYSKAVRSYEFNNDEIMKLIINDIIQKLTFKEETKC